MNTSKGMENLPVLAEEKKLNIFQKIRLEIFKKRMNRAGFDIEKYSSAPEYIKGNDTVIDKLISNIKYKVDYSKQTTLMESSELKEQNLLRIPEDKIIEKIKTGDIVLSDFSIDNQIKFARKVPESAWYKDSINITIKAIEKGEYDFISVFSDIQSDVINRMKEAGNLDEELPNIINYLKNPNPFFQENPNLIREVDIEKQMKLLYTNKQYLKYINEDKQLEYIKEHEEDAQYASDAVLENFIKLDRKNLAKTNLGFQLKIVQRYPTAYKYISKETEKEIWSNPNSEEAAKTAIELLKKDIRYSKKFAEYGFDAMDKAGEHWGGKPNNYYYSVLRDYFENTRPEETQKFFLYSKLLSSKGKILQGSQTIHGNVAGADKLISGIEDYSGEQKKIIQNLNLSQIKELISIDSNYILPYLMVDEEYYKYSISENGEKISKEKCKELFGEIYGSEKLDQLNECINIIYEKNNVKVWNDQFESNSKAYKSRMNLDEIFINEFKILFNKDIVENNSIEDIKEYFEKVKDDKKPKKEFYRLMQNAYGDKAVEILKSRPGLNVHTINSLEAFDKRIISNFGEAFVHDLLSYNIRDYQEFLAVIKDGHKLETFKTYYEALTKVKGCNVETMQKAISEYNYFDELMQNVRDVELTDKQYANLVTVLCSRDNQFDINTLQQLQNYDEISNEVIQKKIDREKNNVLNKGNEDVKNIICGDILGLRIDRNEVRDYGDALEDITGLYEISLEKNENTKMYSEDEINMLECLEFISKEKDKNKLIQLAESLLQEKDIKNPVIMNDAVKKLKEHQTELLNSTLLTAEKMEELCEQEKEKENPGIIKEMTEDGLTKYILRGIDFKIIMHDSFGMTIEDLIQAEMQLGNQYICSRMVSNEYMHRRDIHFGKYCYSSIKSAGGVVAYSAADARTDHLPKRVRGSGGEKSKINIEINKKSFRNEIAQFRRYRNHKDISNENRGGKFLPDFIRNPNETDKVIMKKYNIPILEIDTDVYKKLAEQKIQKQELEERY